MKRFLILVLTLGMCLMFTISGCSCEGDATLEFSNAYIKEIKTETLTYSITLENSYRDIKMSSNTNESLMPKYENGKYISKYEANVSLPKDEYFGNLAQEGLSINRVRTVFSMDVIVKDIEDPDNPDKDITYKDQIISEVYFYDNSLSCAPIYSKTTVKNTYVANDETLFECVHNIYQYTTTYNDDTFVTTKKYYVPDEDEDIKGEMDLENLNKEKLFSLKDDGKSSEYDFREVIDNNQLIFSTRNLPIAKNKNEIIPVVNFVYNKPTKLQLTNTSNSVLNITTDFNYKTSKFSKFYDKDTHSLTIPVRNISITLSDTDYMGLPKYVVVQNGTADEENILNNGLVLEYAEALITYNYNCLGALVYRLNDVDITYYN